MIITTRRPPRILLLDILLTGTAWLAFVYLFTDGVVYMLSEQSSAPLPLLYGLQLSETAITLVLCLVVSLFNASVVYIWARWRRATGEVPQTAAMPDALTMDMMAEHFSLSPNALGHVRDSRVTVVYHSPSGGISRLETAGSDAVTHDVEDVIDTGFTAQESEEAAGVGITTHESEETVVLDTAHELDDAVAARLRVA